MKISSSRAISLLHKNTQRFGALWGPVNERPLVDTVVSTATWPVPYYKRIMRAYPIRDTNRDNTICNMNYDMDDLCAWDAMTALQQSYRGQKIVAHARDNVKSNTFIFLQNDVSKMADAYVNELAQHIDVANKENKRILNSVDLI